MDDSRSEHGLTAVARERGSGSPRQLVVKLLPIKSMSSTVALVRYIARIHAEAPGPPVSVYNEVGEEVIDHRTPHGLARSRLDEELENWPLQADEDNLSAQALTLLETRGPAAVLALPVKDRFRNRQSYHIVVSPEAGRNPRDAARLLAAAQEAVVELFGQTGHSALLALHQDTDHPHVHVVVSARCKQPPFKRLRFGRHDTALDDLREAFARNAREMGLDLVVSRREDREHLRPDIASGAVHLRSQYEMRRGRNRLEEKAPAWFAHHGTRYEERRLALEKLRVEAERLVEAGMEASPAEALRTLLPSESRSVLVIPEAPDLAALFGSRYVEPDRAYDAYREMLAEGAELTADRIRLPNRRLAIWALDKHPIAFGDIRIGALARLSAENRRLLSTPPPSPTWTVGPPSAITRAPERDIAKIRAEIESLARKRRAKRNRQKIDRTETRPVPRSIEASGRVARARPDDMRPSRE